MTEINLIPAEFTEAVARIRELKLAATAAVALALVCFGSGLGMQALVAEVNDDRARLARQHAVSEKQGNELTALSTERDKLLNQREMLMRLRGGAMVTDLMHTIDRALPSGDVWFLDWSFRRAGADTDDDVQSNGYFIVADQYSVDDVQTHMDISGQARDHAALSRFVRALFEQPEVFDVRVHETTVRRYPGYSIVDFRLAVILQSKVG